MTRRLAEHWNRAALERRNHTNAQDIAGWTTRRRAAQRLVTNGKGRAIDHVRGASRQHQDRSDLIPNQPQRNRCCVAYDQPQLPTASGFDETRGPIDKQLTAVRIIRGLDKQGLILRTDLRK